MNIIEAIAAAKEGKVIRRTGWNDSPFTARMAGIYMHDCGDLILEKNDGSLNLTNPMFSTQSVMANDWVAE